MGDLLYRLRRWWEIRRLGIKPPVEYCEIRSTDPPDFRVKGWIPRQVFEDITGRAFVPDRVDFIRRDHSERLHKHPLFVRELDKSEDDNHVQGT